ncbi:TonB-dependent receptor domain-containing protein [Shewanella intestini]|uniref:TonB-dependent receptor n=1 Tax=Shewanella intestini TaxID=2017544 RepID=A0ABS5I4N4_9GAMM|nr:MULTISPECIES: TonB-dependent receptor [Shewanella]MBR9728992.1 TonB-dependent receptor [Shewanella intestini]MRG36942.1 TonB-dependent receptor [Shewanella sp. XMDDZSB0408]
MQSRSKGWHKKLGVWALFIWTLCVPMYVQSQTNVSNNINVQLYFVNIPQANAAQALNLLAKQTEALLIFPYDIAESRTAKAVSGNYSIKEALDLLLNDSGLIAEISDRGVIRVSIENNVEISNKKRNNVKTQKTILATLFAALFTTTSTVNAEESDAKEETVEKIEVTGSRLTRSTFDAPSPTTTVDAETIQMTGALNINDLLSSMPQFSQGFDSTTGNYSFGNSGLNAPNLRDLGVTRTLNLVNGKRPTPMTTDDNIMITDIGVIPSELIERVEIMTGGGSAVYGSDAIAGVVNFILKKDYEGTSFRTQAGTTEAGGGETQSFTLTHGFNFDDKRGNISGSVDFFNQEALPYSERPGAANHTRYIKNPEDTGPDDGIFDNIIGHDLGYAYWSSDNRTLPILDYNTGNYYQVDEQGNTVLSTPADQVDAGWITKDGSGYDPHSYNLAVSPYKRMNAYAQLNYEFDDISLSADVMFSKSESEDKVDPAYSSAWTQLSYLEWYGIDVPQSVSDQFGANDWLFIQPTFYTAGARGHSTDRTFFATSLTLEGSINHNWSWDVYVSTGLTKSDLEVTNYVRTDRYDANSFSAIGECQDTGTCPAYNPFGPASQDFLDYILSDSSAETNVKNHSFAANISGELFELPAGYVQVTAGVDFRYESLDYQPAALWNSGNLDGTLKSPVDDKSRNIQEIYGEILVPLVSDVAFVKNLEIEGAVRSASYSTESSSFISSKLGLNWAINDSVRFRSTYSKATRAPQLGELFNGETIGFENLIDPCDIEQITGGPADGRREINCRALGIEDGWQSNLVGATGQVRSGGNPDLKEEEATTFSAGFVFQPTFIENLRVSVDYYDIDLTDMIVNFGASTMLSNCVDSETIDNDFCGLVSREADGHVNYVYDTAINADRAVRKGYDVEVSYLYEMGSAGSLNVNLMGTRQLEKSYSQYNYLTEELEEYDYLGLFASPEIKADLLLTYRLNDLSARWTTKFTEGGDHTDDVSEELYEKLEVEDSIVHNLWVGYDINSSLNVYAGVNNVADKTWLDHPWTAWGPQNYSLLGRSYYAGLNYNF